MLVANYQRESRFKIAASLRDEHARSGLAVPLLDGVSCAVGLAETLAHQRWMKPRVGSVSGTGGREAHGISPALAALMGRR